MVRIMVHDMTEAWPIDFKPAFDLSF